MSSRIKLTHFRRETAESAWEWGGWFTVSEDDMERHTGTMLTRWQELYPDGNMIIMDLDAMLEGGVEE